MARYQRQTTAKLQALLRSLEHSVKLAAEMGENPGFRLRRMVKRLRRELERRVARK